MSSKTYTLKNGYKLNVRPFHHGVESVYRWCIWAPNGELYRSCSSYKEAYELASHLKAEKE